MQAHTSRTDAKTVSIVALAAFHPNTKVQSAALHFFLGSDTDGDNEGSEDEEEGIREARKDVRSIEHRLQVGKSKKKKQKQLVQSKKEENRVSCSGKVFREADVGQKRSNKVAGAGNKVNFPALELLHDPQTFGEKMYDNLHRHGTF